MAEGSMSMSNTAGRSRDREVQDLTSTKSSKSFKITGSDGQTKGSGRSRKGLNMEWVARLTGYAEGLMARMYKLNKILDYPDPVGHVFSGAFWKAGVFPNYPKLCTLLSKKFPEHFNKLQLERVDKAALDALNDSAEFHLQKLEPWIKLLHDFMAFREQALRIILDISSTVITLLPNQNSIMLHGFMDLFCCFVRVNLFSEKIPWKMILQVYNLLYSITSNEQDCNSYHRLLHFIDSHAPPMKVLQEELSVISSRIGEVLEAVGPVILLSSDTKKLRNEGFLSPYHPRYPHILTNSAHPKKAQDLANVTSYREWVILGYLVCPDELLHVTSIDIASVVLKEHLVLTLFRDEYISLHEEYQLHVLPRISESKKLAKSGRAKQKDADLEYSVAKQVKKMISEVHEQALMSCDAIHRERRILLKQEIGRMVLFFTDQPSLLAPNIQMIFSSLALAQSEILWYFQHVGIASSRSKVAQLVPLSIDPNDPTIGFILDGMNHLCNLVRKYKTAIRGYALSYLSSCAGRIEYLLDTPGVTALELDESLRALFQRIIQHLENVPKPRFENISAIKCDLSDFRKDWLSILVIITSSRSSINIRHLEKATLPTKKEGIMPEGNAAYDWSRFVDELEYQLSKHSSLKQLYFYHQYLTAVFRNTMFGPEGRPQHCCAWLDIASSFIECASPTVPEEVSRIGRDAILYVESLTETIMGGLEGLINILDSEEGFGALDSQLLPEQAAYLLNSETRGGIPTGKVSKGVDDCHLPGYESSLENNNSGKTLEAAIQRLTNLCSVLNDIEPICVLNNVFVLREYLRECIIENFRKRLLALLKTENDLQRPSVLESLIRRQIRIVCLAEQHISMDLIQGIREVLLSEAFSGPVSMLQLSEQLPDQHTGAAIQVVCDWYIDNILKDISGAGILFAPVHKSFKSTRPVGGYFAESFTDPRELQALVRLFGGYGVDRLDKMMKEHTTVLLNCIYTSLCSNREVLKTAANSMHCGDRSKRDACLRQIVGIDTVVEFCIQVGQALVFHQLLAEAARNILEGSAPLIYSLLNGIIKHLPDEIPEKKEIRRMKSVATSICVARDLDSEWVRSLLEEVGGAYDGVWSLLPYLFATFMTSTIWKVTTFNINIGGFSNNFHCLARCISAVIGASEFMRLEYDVHVAETMDMETPPYMSALSSIKAAVQLFIKCAAGIILDSQNDTSRSHLAAKLIFLDQLCETSPYLPRSTLQAHIPYTIIRSIYNQYYGNSGSTVALPNPSSIDSPVISLTRTSSIVQLGNTNPQDTADDSGNFKGSTLHDQNSLNDAHGGNLRSNENKHRNLRRYGPLRYSLSRKPKHSKESTSWSSFSQLPKFAVSRSGSASYK